MRRNTWQVAQKILTNNGAGGKAGITETVNPRSEMRRKAWEAMQKMHQDQDGGKALRIETVHPRADFRRKARDAVHKLFPSLLTCLPLAGKPRGSIFLVKVAENHFNYW